MLKYLVILIGLMAPLLLRAQAGAIRPIPTTKVMAIGHDVFSMLNKTELMPSEIRERTRLYRDGKIDSWYVRKDKEGVVFLLNATSVEEARNLLDALPLVKAHMMEFDLIPMGPLAKP